VSERALVDDASLRLDDVTLTGDRAHHLARVSRVRPGERVTLFDGAGFERDAEVTRVDARAVVLRCVSPRRAGVTADAARVTWLQGVPKGDKLETIARQATELGVWRFVPVWTARSVPRERPDRAVTRHERLLRVVEEAARQCHRADLPEVVPACDLSTALALAPAGALKLLAWERAARSLGSLPAPGEGGVTVLAGPEGGIADEEATFAEAAGFVSISLGRRILRAETVAPALLAVLSARWGDLGAAG
jgi:16S rRNA (uracil1498-N3)-methyltransferase